MGCSYFFGGSNLEKYGNFWKKRPFFRIWPDYRVKYTGSGKEAARKHLE